MFYMRWLCMLSICLLSACGAENPLERGKSSRDGGGTSGGSGGDPIVVDPVKIYTDSVHGLLQQQCKSCHGRMNRFNISGDLATDYSTTVALINPADPASSRLLAKATGQGHGGGTVFSEGSPAYAAILAWIKAENR